MMIPLSHIGHRKRLQKRVDNNGFDTLLDHEFLELLLTCIIARKDTKPIAWALLNRFGSFAGVLNASDAALLDIPGIGPKTVRFFRLIRESFKRYTRPQTSKPIKMDTPKEVLDYCHASLAGRQEEFVEVIFLSSRNTIVNIRTLAMGSVSHITITPRQIIEEVLKEKAAGFIVVHNHPSGDPSPSQDDINWTKQLNEAAKFFGVTFVEHLIMACSGHFSFNKGNLLTSQFQTRQR